VEVGQDFNRQTGSVERPRSMAAELEVKAEAPVPFALDIRVPWWAQPGSVIAVNGEKLSADLKPGSFFRIERRWENDRISIEWEKKLTTCPLPDAPGTVAFLDGSVVLAGLCEDERILTGDAQRPETMLTPDAEREWEFWRNGYRTVGIDHGFRLLPLHEICDERYQVYFPIKG
jgi:DUF1680 family protein